MDNVVNIKPNLTDKSKRRLYIASAIMWKGKNIDILTTLKAIKWMNSELRNYYKGIVDWVEDYE